MSDVADVLLLPAGETARRLGVSRSTVYRLWRDNDLNCVTRRRQRNAVADQIAYVIGAIRSGRNGSIEEFAAEWRIKAAAEAA